MTRPRKPENNKEKGRRRKGMGSMQDAVSWELLLRNPAAVVKLPVECGEKEEIEIVAPEQVARLLNIAYEWARKKHGRCNRGCSSLLPLVLDYGMVS